MTRPEGERDALICTLLSIQFADPQHVMDRRETCPSFNDQALVADVLLEAGYRLTSPEKSGA